ncbi:MAG TPA: hypothetical protein VHM01_13750 [Alphaproteobacteria bacterium]|nr:hypothetical protein [Alphaproteobacteria bacterium]
MRLRGQGETHERAISRAILAWLRHCTWADGREARIRVTQVLLAARAMAPRDYEDWVIVALGDEMWGEGVPAAIYRLSIDCRALDIGADGSSTRVQHYEAVGAEVLHEYLRTELPRKVSRLRRLARELFPLDRVRAMERVSS